MAAELPTLRPTLNPSPREDRLAALFDWVASHPGAPEAGVFQILLDEVDRLRPPQLVPDPLSPPERAVVIGLARGETASQTAKRMDRSYHTVRMHRRRVTKRLGAACGAHIVALAFANGWITAADIVTEGGNQG